MTMQQFIQLTEMEKVSAIMQYGRLVAQSSQDDLRIFIYKLDTFYVFTSYCQLNDTLNEITCFLELSQLIPGYRKMLSTVNPAERQYETPKA